jgi:hypothetical protein
MPNKTSLKDHVYLYSLKPEVVNAIKVTKDKVIAQTTITAFCSLRGDDYKSIFLKLKPVLYKIRDQEKVILFGNEKIYYHTYNILFLITRYLYAIDFYNSSDYKKTFAGLRGDTSQMQDKYHQHRTNIFDSSNAFTGDDKAKALLFRNFYQSREVADLFINFYTLNPTHTIKVSPEDQQAKTIVDKIIDHFSSTYIESEDVIYKSFSISLNAYFKFKMNIKSKHAKECTEAILTELFDYTFTASSADLQRNVYISGRLKSLPIFKHAREPHQLEIRTLEKFDTLFKELSTEFTELESNTMSAKDYFTENPTKQFLALLPIEFLQEIK